MIEMRQEWMVEGYEFGVWWVLYKEWRRRVRGQKECVSMICVVGQVCMLEDMCGGKSEQEVEDMYVCMRVCI